MQVHRINNIENTPKYTPVFNAKYTKTREMISLINDTAGTAEGYRVSNAIDEAGKYFKNVLLELYTTFSEKNLPNKIVIKNLENGNKVTNTINAGYKRSAQIHLMEEIANPKSDSFAKLFGDDSMSLNEIKAEKERLLSKLL